MNHPSEKRFGITKKVLVFSIFASAVTVFLVMALLVDIFEKKQEGQILFNQVVEITDDTTDPAEWGKNFPIQYEDFLKSTQMIPTKHGGSKKVPRTPTEKDPREFTSRSKLEKLPGLKRMWAGYAFARDFREARGHAYMLIDQTYTRRQEVPQVGACLQCHGSAYVPMKKLGDGDLFAGFEKMNQMPFHDALPLVKDHPVTCIDCHEPNSMKLRITRPAFIEGIAALKANEGIENYDVNTMASTQEMRSYTCAQCHVEYYFKGDEKRLTFPWAKGLKVEDMYEYYQDAGFKDWVHAETKANMLKTQHPEFEMWSQSVHARAGVSCADCHMPYKRVGAVKVSDHHLQSPMLDINRSCQTCHKTSEKELLTRVEISQARNEKVRNEALAALVELIDDIKTAMQTNVPEEKLEIAREAQRKATFYLDYCEAENSAGAHAPQEAVRIFAEAIDTIRQGQLALREIAGNKEPAEEKNIPKSKTK